MSAGTYTDDSQQLLINRYSIKEEILNSVTHGVGALLSIVALCILVAFASIKGDLWRIISFSIYGFSLFFLYTSSTLYHSIFHEKAKRVLRVFDHISIYLVIAGSYTPIALVSMHGPWGWGILLAMVPTGLISWLVAGGLIYTIGVVFYVCKKIPFNHAIWHLFVLGGNIVHYLGILFHIAL